MSDIRHEEFKLDLPLMVDSAYLAAERDLNPLRRLDAKSAFSVRGELVRRIAAAVKPLLAEILSERESALNLTADGTDRDTLKQLVERYPALRGAKIR